MANIESRRSDDGVLTHRAKVRLKGHKAESATFTRLTDARRWAQATEAAIREGRYSKAAEAKRHARPRARDAPGAVAPRGMHIDVVNGQTGRPEDRLCAANAAWLNPTP